VKRMESNYIKALLRPNGSKPRGRRVWSIDLETVWLPFFTATNTMGETAIAHDALGAPLRLAYGADGAVKFSKAGKPVIKVAKEVADSVKMVRENFVAGVLAYAHEVVTENPDGYKAEIEAHIEAGKPIMERDRQALDTAIASMVDEAIEKAQAQRPKVKAKGQRKPKVVAEAEKEAVAVTA